MIEIPERLHSSGKGFLLITFIFFLAKENGTKRKRPCPAYPCASTLRPERAETHPPCGGLRQSARFFPSAPPMLGAGQRELKNHKVKSRIRFKDLFRWILSMLLAFHLNPRIPESLTPQNLSIIFGGNSG
jgi:hypothetical protein